MIHHTEAVPHRRIALARTLELPSRLRLEELVVTRPVLARADRPIGTHMAENEIGPDGHHLVTGETDPPGGGHADIVMDDIRPPNETFDNICRDRRLQRQRARPIYIQPSEKGPHPPDP